MPLAAGQALGTHEIIGLLGAGGMGEVYRARDTRLNRQVAIKILPRQYSSDPDRVARFEREAQAVAALNHPGVAAIYEFNHLDGLRFLVLELVEGDTLADLLERSGPLDVERALTIARDIAAAVEAAHEKGICHRDLKPGNVKVTPDGTVKVLDFGLAKMLETAPAAPALTQSPTLSLAGTYPGVILGTAGYMAPEQAKGFAADQRSDVFAFGCILYEMLTGRRAFEGDTASDVLAAVLKTEPDFARLPSGLHPRIAELLRRCLEKNPKKRWHAIADVRLELEAILERRAFTPEGAAPSARRRFSTVVLVAAAAAAAILAGALMRGRAPEPVPARIVRFAVTLPEGQQLHPPNRALVALSPDGSTLVYHANDRLYVRELSNHEPRAIAGSEGLALSGVIFSPDGRSLAFHAQSDRTLKRLALTGGAPVTICAVPRVTPAGMVWSGNRIIYAALGAGIFGVEATGGAPQLLVQEREGESLAAPSTLPDGETLIYSVATGSAQNRWDSGQVVAQRAGSSERVVLFEGGAEGRYVPTGHLVYAHSGTLFAARFDPDRLQVIGGPVPVVEGVRRTQPAPNNFQSAQYVFSQDGSLAYVPGPAAASISQTELALFDRKGNAVPLGVPTNAYYAPRVSPDGRYIVVGTDDGREAAIWVLELNGGRAIQRLTFEGSNRHPIWSDDSVWVAFQSNREEDAGIFRQRVDGTGTVERLTKAEPNTSHIPHAWSPDGSELLYSIQTGNRYALWSLTLRGRLNSRWRAVESGVQAEAVFSPDGRWVAYQSDETGVSEIYVEPAAGQGQKYIVPRDFQNHHPLFSPQGGELFYIPRQGFTHVIDVTTSPRFSFGTPTRLERGGRVEGPPQIRRNHDLLPDGQRFVGVQAAHALHVSSTNARVHVILNWFDELNARVPR